MNVYFFVVLSALILVSVVVLWICRKRFQPVRIVRVKLKNSKEEKLVVLPSSTLSSCGSEREEVEKHTGMQVLRSSDEQTEVKNYPLTTKISRISEEMLLLPGETNEE